MSPLRTLGLALSMTCLTLVTPPLVRLARAETVTQTCIRQLSKLPGNVTSAQIQTVCETAKVLDDCKSVGGEPILHYDREAFRPDGKKILVMGLIHGDEEPSGSVARSWMARLAQIKPRNAWRVLPIVNPDGWAKKTRTNSNGVDLNRNFPTEDWDKLALSYWKKSTQSDPRRYPGAAATSEKETACAVKHFEDFKPDFIVSIHTPYGLLDFDGPRRGLPRSDLLPWRFLGHYPGSLGRFMWHDRKIPVLTIELKESGVVEAVGRFDALQDIAGAIALSQPAAKE